MLEVGQHWQDSLVQQFATGGWFSLHDGNQVLEELPKSRVENGNNKRKIHSAYLIVLYQETKVFTLQSCTKPMIRMVRPMEVETGAWRTGHPEQPAGVLGGSQGSLTWKRFSSQSGPKSITLPSPEQYSGPPRLPTWNPILGGSSLCLTPMSQCLAQNS